MTYISISIYLYISINIYILLVQEEDCTMREAQSLSTEKEFVHFMFRGLKKRASHVDRTFYSLSIDSLPIGWIYLVPEPLDALSPFNPLSEIRVALWRAHTEVNIPVLPLLYCSLGLAWAFPAQLREGGQSPLNESNLPKDVIYSLSLSIYGKNCTHAMIFKSFLLKWNSDFRTISYKRMEIHHFAMKTT
ncbi:hypothetical protein ACJX0J_003264 [Zea mays]